MGFFDWFNEEEIAVSNELNAHDVTLYSLVMILIVVLILYFARHKYIRLRKADSDLKNEIRELREVVRHR